MYLGLAFLQKMYGNRPDTNNNHILIIQALKGYRKNFPNKDNCRPITVEILEALFNILPNIWLSTFKLALFRAAFVLAYFTAFRIREIVAPY